MRFGTETLRRIDRDRAMVERLEQLEGNQARILGLLRRIDGDEAVSRHDP